MKQRWLAFGLVGVIGCGTGASGGDAGDAAGAADAPRRDAATDAGDARAGDANDANDATDASDASDADDASNATDATDAAEMDAADAADATLADAGDEATSDAAADDAADAPAADASDDDALDAVEDAGDDAALDALDETAPADDAATAPDADDAGSPDAPASTPLRIVTGNLTSGNLQSYDPGEGIRIFQALHPDVALIQEFNYGDNSTAAIRSMIDMAFGPEFSYFRGTGQIPNGIASRYPIVASGEWDDPRVTNREFVWARIDLPGPVDLWAVSVHLLTSNSTDRDAEAHALVSYFNTNVPAGDYLVLGGDFNTSTRGESAITTLSAVLDTAAPYPADQNGNSNTNANRTRPYDWLIADAELSPLRVSDVFGTSTYADGLVFDTRVYTPLSDVPPALATDSAASNMQHEAVVKDFVIPN